MLHDRARRLLVILVAAGRAAGSSVMLHVLAALVLLRRLLVAVDVTCDPLRDCGGLCGVAGRIRVGRKPVTHDSTQNVSLLSTLSSPERPATLCRTRFSSVPKMEL